MDWAGLAVVLGAVAATVLVIVPCVCRRCQCQEEEERRPIEQTHRRSWNVEQQSHRSTD
jgi:hypothetical protein